MSVTQNFHYMRMKMMESKMLYCKRSWLNKEDTEGSASLITSIVKSEGEDTSWFDYDCALDIRDCQHTVSLSIHIDSEKELQNSLYKIDTIINDLSTYRNELIKTRPLYIADKEIHDKNKLDKKDSK